jgi:hypothetical protein
MPSRFLARLTYANVVSSICLFLVLSGGTAVALSGSNTVFSDDITDGNVRNSDLGFRAVTLQKIGGDAINSGRVVNDSLTGSDLLESTLGQVPSAASADNADFLDNTDSSQFATKPVGSGDVDLIKCDVDNAEATTTSSTAGDPTTGNPGPSVSVDVPENELVAVFATASMKTTGGTAAEVFVNITAAGELRLLSTGSTTNESRRSTPASNSGAVPGGTTLPGWVLPTVVEGPATFTLKYRATGGTATFSFRKLCVIALEGEVL